MRYVTLGGGKRLRAALVFATGEALGAQPDALDVPACALELVHAYSLVHDDLPAMDDDDLRRGRPTTHRAFDEALAILAGQRELHPGARYVFPSVTSEDGSAPQSNMALAMCLRRLGEGEVTVHGFRSAFSTWAAETHAATPDVVECALAHKEQDRIRRAYMRGAFIEQRRALMDQWSVFLADGVVPASNVVEFGRRRAA